MLIPAAAGTRRISSARTLLFLGRLCFGAALAEEMVLVSQERPNLTHEG